jgi:long-chain acyl-CoA synthetase
MNYFGEIKKYKNNIALITEKDNFSYDSVISYVNKFFKGINDRSLVLIKCQNSFEIFIAYIAFVELNCPIMLVDGNLSDENYLEVINAYKPNYIFQIKRKDKIKLNYDLIKTFGSYELIKNKIKNNMKINDQLSLLIPTSGSTGSPKFVRQSYQNIFTNIDQVTQSLNVQSHDRAITTMPLNYTYGLSIVNSHLYNGASIVINNYSFIDKNFWNVLKDSKASNFGGVPFMYEMLDKIGFKKKITKDLKYITQAGGKLSQNLSKKFIKLCKDNNLKFITMYGQTEASSRMSFLDWKFAEKKMESIGKTVNGGKFSIIDDKGNYINEPYKIGELIYEGKNVSMGYASGYLDLNKKDENKGKLFTGDLAEKDNEGFYYIRGRLKRFSKIFGVRINLDEIEILIKKLKIECICTGNDKILSFYLIDSFDKEEMTNKISKTIGIHRSAIHLKKIEAIPRNSSGKILYSELDKYA